MIQIVTARTEAGFPTEWETFEDIQLNAVPMLLGLRFDKELAAMVKAGEFIGVNRWTEAVWKWDKFAADSLNELRRISQEAIDKGSEEEPDEDGIIASLQDGEDFALWVVSHPYFGLRQRVGVWAAVNASGKRSMTLREVYEIPDRDFDYVGEDLFADEVAPDEAEVDPGKA